MNGALLIASGRRVIPGVFLLAAGLLTFAQIAEARPGG